MAINSVQISSSQTYPVYVDSTIPVSGCKISRLRIVTWYIIIIIIMNAGLFWK